MHKKTFSQLFAHFQTKENGLTKAEVQKRLRKYGYNEIKAKGKTPLWIQFFAEFKDLMVIILLAAVIISFWVGEHRDAAVILFIVLLNAIIGFIQKFKAEKALEALQKMVSPQAKVIREGQIVEIEAREIVPGDILIIEEGDKIPADARLFEENEVEVEEAALTGESVPVAKQASPIQKDELHLDEHQNIVFMGTTVAHGTGKAVVIHTGMDTEFGKIAHLTTSTKKDKSPLEKELFKVGIFVGKVTIIISALLFLVGFFGQGKEFSETFLFAVAVAVAAVPEGLPATITIALALGVQRLAKKNAIVKQLSSVETLGSTTVICSDKTGTLTKNEMTVQELWTRKQLFTVSGSGYKPEGRLRVHNTNIRISTNEKHPPGYDLELLSKQHPPIFDTIDLACRVTTLCNNASLNEEKGKWKMIGDPTEGALLTMSAKAGFDLTKLNKNFKRLHEFPFDSKRKMMTTINKAKNGPKITAYTKGAPDSVIDNCESILINGKLQKLTQKDRVAILKQNDQMAGKALRVLALAYRELPSILKEKYSKEGVEKNLTFIGLVGMIDPPREGVKEAVAETHAAGIKTYIVTGDNGLTAEAIARQIGLVKGKKVRIVTGTELNSMDEKKLLQEFKKHPEIIFSRVSPEHKLKIVTAVKHRGEIVAVTGDGVNDAPALKRADIGIAMGIAGTDVSREAANMILADDSFSTIVTAIKEGRTIYENLKKFIFYIFSCNIGELVTVFAAILIGLPYPLTAILILAVDLGTDVLPALALGVDPPEPGIMQKPPRNPREHILKKSFIIHFVSLGTFIGAVVTGAFIWQLTQNGWVWGEALADDHWIYLKASTFAFALLVLIQMVNAFNSRSNVSSIFKIGVFSNRKLLAAIMISILTVLLFVEVPWIADYLHTTHLTAREWGLIALASLSVLVFEEVRKLIFRPREKKYKAKRGGF